MNEWKTPSPHQCLGAIVVCAFAALQAGLFPKGSKAEMVLNMIMAIAGLLGINVAAKFIPPHVKEVLAVHDEQVRTALAAQEPTTVFKTPEDK